MLPIVHSQNIAQLDSTDVKLTEMGDDYKDDEQPSEVSDKRSRKFIRANNKNKSGTADLKKIKVPLQSQAIKKSRMSLNHIYQSQSDDRFENSDVNT